MIIKNLFFLKSTWAFLQNFSPSCQRFLLGRLLILICLGNSFKFHTSFLAGEFSFYAGILTLVNYPLLHFREVAVWVPGWVRGRAMRIQGASLAGWCRLPLHSQQQLRGPSQPVHSTTWHIYLIVDSESLSKLAELVLQMYSKHRGLMFCFN